MPSIKDIIDEDKIFEILQKTSQPDVEKVREILNRALDKKGLAPEEAGYLISVNDSQLLESIFATARQIKQEIYGERLVFFAPLYVSSHCVNNCRYCGFQRNHPAPRKKLTLEEVQEQVKILEDMGHKRLLLEFGEDPLENPIDYVTEVIKTIYQTKSGRGEIRRLNVNIAATTIENYKKLKEANIGTYQLFQETYHQETYQKMHQGPKADYSRQLFAHDRALEAGLDDIGLGVLFGLYDWRFEVLALIFHAQYLDKKFGIGPHTISVPRWQPTAASDWQRAPYEVSPEQLLKIIAILRIAVPYTGMIISTRESPQTRAEAFEVGISQTSSASRTSPGGYGPEEKLSQFSISDRRTIDETMLSILEQQLLPSFCTACYRLGRTGHGFMDFAKHSRIHNFCRPNGLLTFKEYLEDYASEEVKRLGLRVIDKYLEAIDDSQLKEETKKRLRQIERGKRDLYF